MKRLIPVVLLLLIIIAATIYSSIAIERTTAAMLQHLEQAQAYTAAEQYPEAVAAIQAFRAKLSEHETLFLLFVRRDLYYNVRNAAASLEDYAFDETKHDLAADLERTIEHIEIIRHMQLRPA